MMIGSLFRDALIPEVPMSFDYLYEPLNLCKNGLVHGAILAPFLDGIKAETEKASGNGSQERGVCQMLEGAHFCTSHEVP